MKKLYEPDFSKLLNDITEYARLKNEYGASGVQGMLDDLEKLLKDRLDIIMSLPNGADLERQEPDEYEKILALRPAKTGRLWNAWDEEAYREKLEGALLSRLAGCTLGTIVEFWNTNAMEDWAKQIGDPFPPVDYWSKAKSPLDIRYGKSTAMASTRDEMNGVPVDDDIMYTILGLLIAEDYGVDFTTEDVGKAWLKYLPYACTAEERALNNLKSGIAWDKAAEIDNPYVQWIGADIRSDGFAYLAPANPEKAAKMAYRDAYISHRRNGIYGEMFFSAAQSAAFAVNNSMDAIEIGLREIPKDCNLAHDIRWALSERRNIRNYSDAVDAVKDYFVGMSGVHTNLNACLTIFGLSIGGNDVTKVISETVAMGYDNDCTAATAGSIVGAIVGKGNVPPHWYKRFNNTIHSYLIGNEKFEIDDILNRFTKIAKENF